MCLTVRGGRRADLDIEVVGEKLALKHLPTSGQRVREFAGGDDAQVHMVGERETHLLAPLLQAPEDLADEPLLEELGRRSSREHSDPPVPIGRRDPLLLGEGGTLGGVDEADRSYVQLARDELDSLAPER